MSHCSSQKIIMAGMLLWGALLIAPITVHGNNNTVPGFEDEHLRVRLVPRSNEQMAAFFEARGFPSAMREVLLEYCFFTVVIKNKRADSLTLDLTDWQFSSQSRPVQRIPRAHWPPLWRKLKVPKAAQATFRWTLLPERLDFFGHESEGGNIMLQKTHAPFSLRARFGLGGGRTVMVTVEGLQCVDGTEVDL